MIEMKSWRRIATIALCFLLLLSGGGTASAQPTLVSIAVTPASASIGPGETQQYKATGTYSDASTADITNTVTWESSLTSVATIDSAGLATGAAAGTTGITATLDAVVSNEAQLTVAALITSVEAVDITDYSATITWTTDVPSDSVVDYTTDITEPITWTTVTQVESVTEHSVDLTSLTPETEYYYRVSSTYDTTTATDDNGGSYYTFTTLGHLDLEGWGWCPDYSAIGDVTMSGSIDAVPRVGDPNIIDLHFVGTLTFTVDATVDTFDLELFGTRVRSIFSLAQVTEDVSASFNGMWLTSDSQDYILVRGTITTHPGEVIVTVKPYSVVLRTSGDVPPAPSPDGWVADLEYLINRIVNLIDDIIDSLIATDFLEVLGDVLSRIVTIFAEIREILTPYIP